MSCLDVGGLVDSLQLHLQNCCAYSACQSTSADCDELQPLFRRPETFVSKKTRSYKIDFRPRINQHVDLHLITRRTCYCQLHHEPLLGASLRTCRRLHPALRECDLPCWGLPTPTMASSLLALPRRCPLLRLHRRWFSSLSLAIHRLRKLAAQPVMMSVSTILLTCPAQLRISVCPLACLR